MLQPGFDNISEPSNMIEAPLGFDWRKYPEQIQIGNSTYRYVGTTNADPHYAK